MESLSPTGKTPTAYISSVPTTITEFVQNPNVKSGFIFAAYSNGLGSLQGIYSNSTLSLTGAIKIVPAAYGSVVSLNLTQDGKNIVFTATDSTNEVSNLFSATIAGKGLVQLDTSAGSAVSPSDSDTIVYSNAPTGSAFQLYTRSLSGGASATVTPLTTDTIGDKFGPAFSRDGTKVAYQLANYTTSLTNVSVITVSSGKVVDLPNPVPGYTPYAEAFSGDGGTIAILATSGTSNHAEILTQAAAGTGTASVNYDSTLIEPNSGVYWTSSGGRTVGGSGIFGTSIRNGIRKLNRAKFQSRATR